MEFGKIIYLSGKITGKQNFKDDFEKAEQFLVNRGYCVLNPTRLEEVSSELSYEQYMKLCYTLIDICDIVFMVSGWQKSKGANAELHYAKSIGKEIRYQDYYAPFRKVDKYEKSSEDYTG